MSVTISGDTGLAGAATGALNGTLGATTPSTVVATTISGTDLTTTGNTILGNASTDTLNVGNGGLVKDASGNVGVGVTPASIIRLQVYKAADPIILIQNSASGTTANDGFALQLSGSIGYIVNQESGGISVISGTLGQNQANGGTTWTSLSDETEKTIIEPITNALAKLASVRSVIGRYNIDDVSKRRVFFVAQDWQEILPESVNVDDSGKLRLAYTDTIPLLAAAIQELKAELDITKAKVAALEAA